MIAQDLKEHLEYVFSDLNSTNATHKQLVELMVAEIQNDITVTAR